MELLRLWWLGYRHPSRAVDELRAKPAPWWGLYGVLLRCAMVSLLWYLPAAMAGRVPAAPPRLVLLPGMGPYEAMAVVFPLVTLGLWLSEGCLAHLMLRATGRGSNLAQILNADGMGYFGIALPVLAYDWLTLALGAGGHLVLWGAVHLLIDGWYVVYVVTALRRNLGLPLSWALGIVLFWFVYSVPVAMWLLVP